MLYANADVFDEMISGTAGTWYSASQHNGMLGGASGYAIFATPTNVAGTTPTLSLAVDSSIDGRAWVAGGNLIVGSNALANGVVLYAANASGLGIGAYGRLRITLGGTSPTCRLKVSVTARQF